MTVWISLEEARKRLGDDVVICLEPEGVPDIEDEGRPERKSLADKLPGLWVFDPRTGRIQRGDGKFHAAGVVKHPGGWNLAAVIEEPSVEPPEEGPHVVGHVIVEVNPRGFVRRRLGKGLSGAIHELMPSSISKGEGAGEEEEPVGYFEANCQRICGSIAVYLREVDFPDDEGMTPERFRKCSEDGRSLSALAVAGLLHGSPVTG